MRQDEAARKAQQEKIKRFAEENAAHGFSWGYAMPWGVDVQLLSRSRPIFVDLSAVDPDKFLDVVLNAVFSMGTRIGTNDFRDKVVKFFTVNEEDADDCFPTE